MLKEVTKNLQATSPTCNHSPLREGMQSSLTVTKGATGENTSFPMATALASSNPAAVGLSESHTGVMNGELPLVDKSPIKLTIKRKNISADTSSPSSNPEESFKSDNQGGNTPVVGHSDTSTHRHAAINGKILPPASSSSSLSHSAHGELSRTVGKRPSCGGPAGKRPKSTSKRDRSSCGKSAILPLSTSPNLVNGRPNPNERTHDPYQFSVKKEEETVLPPKKLRLDSSLNRLPDRTESFKDQGTNTRNQGTTVDHDLLGPCEPGTQINLDGYVCLETLTGMLMVSVRWRNRTYLGTLIDSTSHGFSPPVPPSYVYHTNRYSSAIESGSLSASGSSGGRSQRGRGKRRCGFAPSVGGRHSRKGRRNARGSPVTGSSSVPASSLSIINPGDESNEDSQSRGASPASENPLDDGEPSFKCPQPGCHKRFKDGAAGKLHMDECHSKKSCDLPSEPEIREKRPKPAKTTGKSKKHNAITAASRPVGAQIPTVKSEPVTNLAGLDNRTVKAETVPVKTEFKASNIPAPFFKTPLNNGITSPPLLPYSPSPPSAPHLPSSPANGLKHPSTSGSSCSPDTLNLPQNVSSHQMKLPPAASPQQQIPPSQQHELPVRIPTSNSMLVRVGVTSTSGGSSIGSATISVSSSSASTPRTVTATTVKTIPVMKPSTVASSSSLSSGSSSGKKSGSKEPKNGGSIKVNNARSSHTTGTVSASTVTVPAVSSPLGTVSQGNSMCSSSLKPIQPKPLIPSVPSPNGNGSNKGAVIANQSNASDTSKRPPNSNPSRKRKKSSGVGSESGKRQSLSCGNNPRAAQGRPGSGGKRSSSGSGSICSDGITAGQGDRASPAYSDISDDNESPIPILEKEGDVKLMSDPAGGCDEVGKASEQTSGSGGFYNTPPSLVPFSVYSAADQATVPPGNLNNSGRVSNLTSGTGRPTSLTKKSSSPAEGLSTGSAPSLGKASAPVTPVIPGTTPLTLTTNQCAKKHEPARAKEFGQINSSERLTPTVAVPIPVSSADLTTGNDSSEKNDASRNSHSIEEHTRAKKTNEPPNLTKISTSTTLTSLSLPSAVSSMATSVNASQSSSLPSQNTVAKPTPVNPLSPLRSSDLPSSTPAVVTPGVLVGGSRPSEFYPNRPDHLPTPPTFHPAPPGGPFGPGSQFAAHLSSPGPLGPQNPFPPYASEMLRFVHPGGPHPATHPFSGYPYPAEPFFASPPVSSTPQPHKIHELVEKSAAAASTPSCTSVAPGIPSLCTSTSTTPSNLSSKSCISGDATIPMDLQTAKSLADMAVAMRHHGMPNHAGIPQSPTLGGMVPPFPYSGGIPPAHMAATPYAAMQQHTLPPGHPSTTDAFFPPGCEQPRTEIIKIHHCTADFVEKDAEIFQFRKS